MKFVLIFGPQAVGKMTVGHELEKVTGLKLLHNHMTIDLSLQFFNYNSPSRKNLSDGLREVIFHEVANSDLEGLVFTYVWAFDIREDWDYVDHVCEIFESKGGTVYFVELEADVDERLERNKSSHRLEHKVSKRNIEESEADLKRSLQKHRLNSMEGEVKKEKYMRINNTHLSPEEVALMIKEKFQL